MSGSESALAPQQGLTAPAAVGTAGAVAEKPFTLFGEDGFTFSDFLDIINPLQHIPLVSALYRHLTGDDIDAAPRVLGGTLFGGPIGAVASLINVFVEEGSGKDIGEHAIALFTDDPPASNTAMAGADVPEARFETAAGTQAEPRAATTDTIIAAAQASRFAGGMALPAVKTEPLAPAVRVDASGGPSSPDDALEIAAATLDGKAQRVSKPGARIATTTVLRQGEDQADAFAMLRYRVALRDADGEKERERERPAAGATAAQGGWFSDAMLSGLSKYDEGVKRSQPAARPSVDLGS